MSSDNLIHTLDCNQICSEYPIKFPFIQSVKQIFYRILIILQIKFIPCQFIIKALYSLFLHNSCEFKMSFMIWRLYCSCTSEMYYFFTPILKQNSRRQSSALLMIDCNHRNIFSQITVKCNDWFFYLFVLFYI